METEAALLLRIDQLKAERDGLRSSNTIKDRALEFSSKQLEHRVPEDCWATGPMTGDAFNDLVACPGCEAIRRNSQALHTEGKSE